MSLRLALLLAGLAAFAMPRLFAQTPADSVGVQDVRVIAADSVAAMPDSTASVDATADTSVMKKRPFGLWKHQEDWPRPKTALRWAFVPGMGQVYNRQLWKLPIVYGALGTCAYFAVNNQNEYVRYRNAYRLRVDGDSTTIDEFDGLILNPQSLQTLRNQYRQNRDLSIVLGMLAYLGTLMDAYVSAHLTHFDVSDDLALDLMPPVWMADRRRFSVGLVLTFR